MLEVRGAQQHLTGCSHSGNDPTGSCTLGRAGAGGAVLIPLPPAVTADPTPAPAALHLSGQVDGEGMGRIFSWGLLPSAWSSNSSSRPSSTHSAHPQLVAHCTRWAEQVEAARS